jgi:hypothetical protein
MLGYVARLPSAATPADTTFTGPLARHMVERQDRIRLAAPHHGLASLSGLLIEEVIAGPRVSSSIPNVPHVPHVPGKHTDQRRSKEEDQ